MADNNTNSKPVHVGTLNLDPCRDTETARKRGAIGGVKSGESKRRKRDMRELAKALLETQYSKEKAKSIIGEDNELIDLLDDTTVANVLNLRMMQEAQNGNVKAYETLRDTAGFKPSENVKLDANVMSDNDKALLEKVAKRNGINTEIE